MKATKLVLAMFTLLGASALGYWGTRQLSHKTPSVVRAHWAKTFTGLDEMAQGVDLVVVGTVRGAVAGRVALSDGGEDGVPYSNVTLVVNRVLKGTAQDRFIVLEQTGGVTPDGSVLSIDDGGPYEPGERYVLFLNKQAHSALYYLVNPQGRFQVKGGRMFAAAPGDRVAAALHRRAEQDGIELILSATGQTP